MFRLRAGAFYLLLGSSLFGYRASYPVVPNPIIEGAMFGGAVILALLLGGAIIRYASYRLFLLMVAFAAIAGEALDEALAEVEAEMDADRARAAIAV